MMFGRLRCARLLACAQVCALLLAVSGVALAAPPAPAPPAPVPPAPVPPMVREFHLYAGDLMQEVIPGGTLYAWGFGLWDPVAAAPASPPTIPGPTLRANAGEKVRVVFHNRQGEPHTIHWHGLDTPFAQDGTAGVSEPDPGVEQGDSRVYEFIAPQPGTYWYHCHVEPHKHPEMGLYGAFVIDSRAPSAWNREFILMLAERDPRLPADEGTEAGHAVGNLAEPWLAELAAHPYNTSERTSRYFLINGQAAPLTAPLPVVEGDKVLIRLINAGQEIHSFHTHGHHFRIIASDGRPIPDFGQLEKDTVVIGPGERYDLLFTANNPGAWPVHCHMGPHNANDGEPGDADGHPGGMHAMLVYPGFEAYAHH